MLWTRCLLLGKHLIKDAIGDAVIVAMVCINLSPNCEFHKFESSLALRCLGTLTQVPLGHFRSFSAEGCLAPSRLARPLHCV